MKTTFRVLAASVAVLLPGAVPAQDSTRFAPPAAKYEFTVQKDVMVPAGIRLEHRDA